MDISLQTGKNLKCPYTGGETDVLVTLKGDGEVTAGKLSEEALVKGLALVRSYKAAMGQATLPDPVVPQQVMAPAPAQHHVQASMPTMPAQAPAPQGAMRDNPQIISNFEKELVNLIQNPPDDGQGKGNGLSEIHIRELVKKFKGAFLDPKNMFGPLNRALGMDRDRFDILLAAN